MAIVKKDSTKPKQTFIEKNIKIKGNFEGTGTIQIEGNIIGDINVDSVVIGEGGSVTGNITSKSVIINGKHTGNICCNSLDILPQGQLINHQINVNSIFIRGSVKGNIIASESLEIDVQGSIEGDITFGKIKINEGGKITGMLKEYLKK